jgi:hypothetical protein
VHVDLPDGSRIIQPNGLYRTSTTISVLNGAGLLSLGPEQKSRSLSNLNARPPGSLAQQQQRSISPTPQQTEKIDATAAAISLARLHKYKYGLTLYTI